MLFQNNNYSLFIILFKHLTYCFYFLSLNLFFQKFGLSSYLASHPAFVLLNMSLLQAQRIKLHGISLKVPNQFIFRNVHINSNGPLFILDSPVCTKKILIFSCLPIPANIVGATGTTIKFCDVPAITFLSVSSFAIRARMTSWRILGHF